MCCLSYSPPRLFIHSPMQRKYGIHPEMAFALSGLSRDLLNSKVRYPMLVMLPLQADITHVIYVMLKILKLIFIGPRICWWIEGVCRSAKAEFHTGSGCKKPIPDLMDH